MKVLTLLWRLLVPGPEPVELEPLTPPERALATLGWYFFDEPELPPASADTPVTVDVLVVVTNSVSLSICQQIANRFNEINRNSKVDDAVTLRLVDCKKLAQNSSGSLSTDLSRLRVVGDGYFDEAHTWRDAVGADLVQIVIPSDSGGAAGLGYVNSAATSAFSAVVAQHAVNYMSGPHELGHNFGLHHDRQNGTNIYFPYGYGWRASTWRTVMAYAPGTRIPYWSSPLVTCPNTVPCGNADNDNARVLRQRAPIVATFRTSPILPAPSVPGTPCLGVSDATTVHCATGPRGAADAR